MKRRSLLQAGIAGTALGRVRLSGQGPSIALVVDPSDPVAMALPAQMALEALRQGLIAAGASPRLVEHWESNSVEPAVFVAGPGNATARQMFRFLNVVFPQVAEGLSIVSTRGTSHGAPDDTLFVCGADARGLSYALLEMADRVRAGANVERALRVPRIEEHPVNPARSVMRQFVSEPLDRPWFHDRAGWSRYLTMLATHRFNRLHLAFGLGYDALQRVTDSYLLFAYPFFVQVPGSQVRVTNLPDEEREQNLEMLRFISEETVAHGLDFQLGIWMHGYQLINSPDARYVVEGLNEGIHAPYCRDALALLLRECPSISSVGLRIHGESGIAEGSYEFWGTVFNGVAQAGRPVEIDLHAKGIDATMIARAQATGMPVNVSPKFAAEHLGLPYHQAAIRDLEMPVAGRTGQGLMTLSEGSRVFTRYGYADLLREDRTYTVRPRVFSGTQRLLAWGDPDFARAFSEAAGFCGMTGADLMEPLTCRGRRGTGVGRRDGYKDAPPWRDDWAKYSAWYRSFGRMMYSRGTPPDVFAREVGEDGQAAALRSALAKASRILPIVTQAHLPSAACDAYWPEIYWNQPMVRPAERNPYFDTGTPATFQHVSPLDPALFSSCAEYAAALLEPRPDARYSPVDVALRIEVLGAGAFSDLHETLPRVQAGRVLYHDIQLLLALSRFYGAKLRAGVLYAVHESTGSRAALEGALAKYREARRGWEFCAVTGGRMYQVDLSASDRFDERGQWSDRLVLMDADIEQMEQRLPGLGQGTPDGPLVERAIAEAGRTELRRAPRFEHVPPPGITEGQGVSFTLRNPVAGEMWIHYRHVNQADRWVAAPMDHRGGLWRFVIPASYADSPYPLQYYFEFRERGGAVLWPGFAPDLLNQPYFVLRHRS